MGNKIYSINDLNIVTGFPEGPVGIFRLCAFYRIPRRWADIHALAVNYCSVALGNRAFTSFGQFLSLKFCSRLVEN